MNGCTSILMVAIKGYVRHHEHRSFALGTMRDMRQLQPLLKAGNWDRAPYKDVFGCRWPREILKCLRPKRAKRVAQRCTWNHHCTRERLSEFQD